MAIFLPPALRAVPDFFASPRRPGSVADGRVQAAPLRLRAGCVRSAVDSAHPESESSSVNESFQKLDLLGRRARD